jgi:hypothetical protein
MDQLIGIWVSVFSRQKYCSFRILNISHIRERCGKILAYGFLVFWIIFGIGCASKAEEHQYGLINKPMSFGIRNLTVVEIIPGDHAVSVDWKGYGTLTGNAFKVGFEELCVSDSRTTFLITDKDGGNNQLSVNGVKFSFNGDGQHLVIRFGAGIKVVDGVNYKMANHVYDKDLFPAQ